MQQHHVSFLPVYGFLFLRPPIEDFSSLSSPAITFLFELYCTENIQFIFCDGKRKNTKHLGTFHLPGALELVSHGLLINTNISNN